MGQEMFDLNVVEYKCDICKDKGKLLVNGKLKKCECQKSIIKDLVSEDIYNSKVEKVIPENFRGEVYDKTKVYNSNLLTKDYKKNPEVVNFLDTMEKLYNKHVIGEKLNYSMFISAPQNMGKNHLVYSCMEAYLKIGKTVAPYLDSLEIHGLLYRYKETDMDLLEKLVTSDLCFIKLATGLSTLSSNMQAIKIIVDRRARNGLPTLVTSRFGLNYLLTADNLLDSFIVRGNYEESRVDYSRLRVIEAPFFFKQPEKQDKSKKGWN